MAEVILRDVWKRYDGTSAVKNVSIDIPDKEFFILVGPSGCGKSTTLRMIAGLEEVSDGKITIGGREVNNVPPKDRDIAMVFQNYALYPHMSVYDNMAFGLKLRGYSKKEIDERVKEAGEILNMGNLLHRKPKELSGGQRQRVAVGRAIVRKPKVFLFDEPLSNLDAKLRVQMRTELSKLHDRLQTTMIYVTHDQVEAMTMGDRICVMKDGIVQQIAPPLELYNHPVNQFVAGFIGSPPMNFMGVTITKGSSDSDIWLKENAEGNTANQFKLKLNADSLPSVKDHIGKPAVMGVRPEDIYDRLFYSGSVSDGSVLKATIEVVEPMGAEKYLYLNTGKNSFVARVEPNNTAKPHQDIDVVINMDKIHLFEGESGATIL